MAYKTDEYKEFETLVEKYTRLGTLVADFKIIRAMHFEQIHKNTLSITVDIISPAGQFDYNTDTEKNCLMKLPTRWRSALWEFIFEQYTRDILDLSETLGLKWDKDYILNKLTKN